ncbi:MAG: 2-C-methyl-D-erythritol 4-phosphate cytidylyltransferase [Oligoflexia bacterium]|nr:2-C-methyl-D-erythritol 4-phosphate cytidylyltransferase [Oligoflexia bacterium]
MIEVNDKCDLILVAAGNSTRYGAKVPKQFEEVHGRPLYLWSLEVFLSWPHLGNVVVVVPSDWVLPVKESFNYLIDTKPIEVVAGGKTRQVSATSGLLALNKNKVNPWVMVHDGARPAITVDLLERLWCARLVDLKMHNMAGVVPGVKSKDTIKQITIHNGFELVEDTLSREKLRIIQTPQLLKTDLLTEVYNTASDENAVDDASLLENHGHKILVVAGEEDNLKVTFVEDIERVSSWLRQRHPPL